jgi:hypothetical protein
LNADYLVVDGLRISVSAWQQDNKHFARFLAQLDSAQAETNIKAEISKANSDFETDQKNHDVNKGKSESSSSSPIKTPIAVSEPEKYTQERLNDLAEEIERLNQRLQAWTFIIPAFKYANMDKSLDDLLKPLDKGYIAGEDNAIKN